jgi:hypothetical protein
MKGDKSLCQPKPKLGKTFLLLKASLEAAHSRALNPDKPCLSERLAFPAAPSKILSFYKRG